MLKRFIRKREFQTLLGFGETEFWAAQNDGRISRPDAYLGPRSPVWLETTVEKDQQRLLAAPRPTETRPSRARKQAEARA
jgi:predicted DNA-binding transcriptional regulator AlpA